MRLANKKNINDPREPPSIMIIDMRVNLVAVVRMYDRFVTSILTKAGVFTSTMSVEEALERADYAIFLVDNYRFCGIS